MAQPPKLAQSYRRRPGLTALHQRWWQIEDEAALAEEVCAIVDGLENDDASRRSCYLRNLQLYELKKLRGLHAGGYATDDSPDETALPILRSICDSVQADIAGRQRPLPMFQTSGADWRTRRRAKKLGKFVEAVLHQPQGSYVNGWELACDVFLDSEIYGVGAINVFVDDGKVVLERTQPDELYVDPREADTGDPCSMFRSFLYDEDALIEACVDSRDDLSEEEKALLTQKIHAAAADSPNDKTFTLERYGSTRIARSVKVREAIRRPLSKDKPGVRVLCIRGAVLEIDREWGRDHPFVLFRWSRERRGFWATSLVDEVRVLAEEFNENFRRMQARMTLLSNRRVYRPRSANIDDADIEANEYENIIDYDGPQPPTETELPALNPSDISWHELLKQACYEMPGVSRMGATGQKEPGVTAAIAMRTIADLATKRFAVKARYAYEYPFVDLARKIVAATAEWVERTGQDITVRLPQKTGVRDINWRDVSLDGDLDIQIAPVSSLPSDPAGRLSTVNDLFAAQVIGPATFRRLLDWPDLEQEGARDQAEWEYVESLLERYLDAENDEDARYESPDGFLLRPEQALLQISAEYFRNKREQAPAFNLKLLRTYMKQLNELITRRAAPPPPQQQTTGIPGGPQALPPENLPAGPIAPGPGLPPSPAAFAA